MSKKSDIEYCLERTDDIVTSSAKERFALSERIAALAKQLGTLKKQVQCGVREHNWVFHGVDTTKPEYRFVGDCADITTAEFVCPDCTVVVKFNIKKLPPKFRKIMDAVLKPPEKNK